jgi:hypothetical protein
MSDLTDGFIAARRIGTFEEFLKLRPGPTRCTPSLRPVEQCFYDPLALLDHAVSAGFLPARHRSLVLVESDFGVC